MGEKKGEEYCKRGEGIRNDVQLMFKHYIHANSIQPEISLMRRVDN